MIYMTKNIFLKQVFENNNYRFTYLDSSSELIPYIEELVPENSLVSVGGSMTLFETGLIDHLRSGRYDFLDRYTPGIDTEEVFRKSFFADYYFASANALTEHGEVYMVDGHGNRIAATIYGPKNVILICGRNKIVKNLKEAIHREKTVATPKNCTRLDKKSYCRYKGECFKPEMDEEHLMCSWYCDDSICANTVILGKQNNSMKNRIHIILIDEDLGY